MGVLHRLQLCTSLVLVVGLRVNVEQSFEV